MLHISPHPQDINTRVALCILEVKHMTMPQLMKLDAERMQNCLVELEENKEIPMTSFTMNYLFPEHIKLIHSFNTMKGALETISKVSDVDLMNVALNALKVKASKVAKLVKQYIIITPERKTKAIKHLEYKIKVIEELLS